MPAERKRFHSVLIRNRSPAGQQYSAYNSRLQAIQAQLRRCLACSARTLRQKSEKAYFFLAGPKNRLFDFMLRTFSPMDYQLHREFLCSTRFARGHFVSRRLVDGKIEPFAATFLLSSYSFGFSRMGDFL